MRAACTRESLRRTFRNAGGKKEGAGERARANVLTGHIGVRSCENKRNLFLINPRLTWCLRTAAKALI